MAIIIAYPISARTSQDYLLNVSLERRRREPCIGTRLQSQVEQTFFRYSDILNLLNLRSIMVCPGGHSLSFYARFGGKKSKKEYIRSCSCSLGMRHHISCSSCNFIYMIQCNKLNVTCNTSAKLNASSRDGFGEHRRSIEKARNPHHSYHPTVVSDRLLPSRSFHQGHRTHSIRTY